MSTLGSVTPAPRSAFASNGWLVPSRHWRSSTEGPPCMKQRNVEDKIEVLDIAELVARSIPDVPVDRLVRKKST